MAILELDRLAIMQLDRQHLASFAEVLEKIVPPDATSHGERHSDAG
jgi:hypothetical protein